MPIPRRLALRIAGITAGIALVALAIVGGVARERHLRAVALRQWQDRLDVNAAITRASVQSWLGERWSDAHVVAGQASEIAPIFVDTTARGWPHLAGSRSRLASTLGLVAHGYGYGGGWALDTAGHAIASAFEGPSARPAWLLPALREVIRTGADRLAGPVVARNGTLQAAVVVPVFRQSAAAGSPVGVVALVFDPRRDLLRLAVGEGPSPAHSWSALVLPLDRGALVLSASAAPRARGIPEPARIVARGADTTGIFDWGGIPVIAATRHISATGWGVVRAIPVKDAYAAATAQLRAEVGLGTAALALLLVVALGVGWLVRLGQLRAVGESEARYRLLADNATDMITRHAPDGRYLYLSPAVEALVGYTAAELVGRSPYEFFHEDDTPAVLAAHEALLGAAGIANVRYRFRRKSGDYVWLESHSRAVPGARGATELVTVSRDVTERKVAEDVLSRQAQLFETIHDGVILMELDGRIADWNPGAERIFGYTREEVFGRDPSLLHAPEVRPALEREIRAAIKRDGRWAGEVRFRRKDGEPGVADTIVVALRGADGEPVGLLGVNRDITGRRQMEEALRRSEEELRHAQKMEAVGRLAGGIAHDFNNLLTAITSNAEFALSDGGAAHPVREEIEEIRKAANRAALLTRQLLAFSRKQVLQPRVLDLNALIAEAERMFRRIIGEHIQLVTVLDPDIARVTADPGQLNQVLLNLVVNARDAMPDGGTLTIDTGMVSIHDTTGMPGMHPGWYVRLRVHDTGIGMDAETRERIFEPFFTRKSVGEGTGLGLSTTYGIVRQSSGRIYVDSAPGEGAVFSVYLPATPRPTDVPVGGPVAALRGRGDETVLLVEDDEAVRSSVRRILERHGYTVREARDGQEALALCDAQAGSIDLVITDVVMPEMGGRELVERIRLRHADLKVLFMSGYAEDAVHMHGVLASAASFIEKPFPMDAFIERVRSLLDGAPARAAR